MEFKKKTIIWEDNNEPPKDYIWAKKDGKFYEYSYTTRSWVESKTISGGSGDSGEGENTPSTDITPAQAFAKFYGLYNSNYNDKTQDTPLPDLCACMNGISYISLDEPITVAGQTFEYYHDLTDNNYTIGYFNFDDISSDYIIDFCEEHDLSVAGLYLLWDIDKLATLNCVPHITELESRGNQLTVPFTYSGNFYQPFLFKDNDKNYIGFVYNGD